MDPQVDKFLNEYVDKTLNGPGFITFAPKEKDEMKPKLAEYFSNLIFDTLLRNLTDAQLEELQAIPDLASKEAQDKIALMSASIPGFIFTLEEAFEKASTEIGRAGKIPQESAEIPQA